MAKKKAMPSTSLKNVVVLRGTEEWKAWLDDGCERNHAPITVTIEQALQEYGEKRKWPKMPKRVP